MASLKAGDQQTQVLSGMKTNSAETFLYIYIHFTCVHYIHGHAQEMCQRIIKTEGVCILSLSTSSTWDVHPTKLLRQPITRQMLKFYTYQSLDPNLMEQQQFSELVTRATKTSSSQICKRAAPDMQNITTIADDTNQSLFKLVWLHAWRNIDFTRTHTN